MNEEPPEYPCVVDTDGLYEIASETSGNLKAFFLDQLQSGEIAVPVIVWDEFRDLYPDEAEELEPYISVKVSLRKKAYTIKAAAIAEKLNSGFSRGSYDRHVELYSASIVAVEKSVLVTTKAQLAVYKKMGCKAMELSDWASK